ncbi:MAG TPA: hypothetical protein VHQ64_14425 [Pyrinomonadaceae bacterium]|jgi:hypothetical protein|nr:hypothetical protein [Pyrinomonadaceae bacterium]
MRRHINRLKTPIAKRLPAFRAAARLVSQSPRHGLKLLVKSHTRRAPKCNPDVYPFASFLASMLGCDRIIIIGKPQPHELIHLVPHFKVYAVVDAADVKSCRRELPIISWVPVTNGDLSLPVSLLEASLVICTLNQWAGQSTLFEKLDAWMDHAALCLVTSAGRDARQVEQLMFSHGLDPIFVGLTASDNVAFEKHTTVAVLQKKSFATPRNIKAPADFRVVAFMAAYNEADIIVESIRKWTDQGVHVHILENWSTDQTYELIEQTSRGLPVTCERFPRDGPSAHFEWAAMLARIEELTRELEADWFVRRGADEIMASPWPGISYRDALYLVDRAGFNCVDHTIIEFYPVDNDFQPGMDHETYFRHFDFKRLSHQWQRKAWKNCGVAASSIATAGHDVTFEARRIYPFKFLLKHYSFRSQAHGERKVFRERKPRWNAKERAKGWHLHYDSIREGHQFLQPAAAREIFSEELFNETYLIERLSGVGIERQNRR